MSSVGFATGINATMSLCSVIWTIIKPKTFELKHPALDWLIFVYCSSVNFTTHCCPSTWCADAHRVRPPQWFVWMASAWICYTILPENLVGNLFWLTGSFKSNPSIFHLPKFYSVMSSLLHNHSFCMYNWPAAGCASVIIGMEFTISRCARGHHVSKEFWTPEGKSCLVDARKAIQMACMQSL